MSSTETARARGETAPDEQHAFRGSVPMSRERTHAGFTLLELMITVFILSVLSSVTIAAFSRYVWRAKSTEATINLGNIARAAKVYWMVDHTAADGSILARQFPASTVHPGFCCEYVGGKCPGNLNATELFTDNTTWRDINFAVDDPHIFTYTWSATGQRAHAYAESYMQGCWMMGSYKSFALVLNGDENSVAGGAAIEDYSGGMVAAAAN